MAKLTPKIPLLLDKTQPGYELIDELRELVKQNMKMVLLTNPGERVMNPDFGVGLYGLLFENAADPEIKSFYQGRIKKQIDEYLPYVVLEEVNFFENEIDSNKISIQVRYIVPDLEVEDILEI